MDGVRLVIGLLLSGGIGGLAYWRGSLTAGGWAGAVLVGTLTLVAGGWALATAVVVFFATSTVLSRYKARIKEQRFGATFAKGGERDFTQVLANGGVVTLVAVAFGATGQPPVLLAAATGVLATVTADTWATELGVLSTRPPRLITTGKRVAPGTSGGITVVGTVASLAGGTLIGVVLAVGYPLETWLVTGGAYVLAGWLVLAGLAGGLAGSLTDSLLGATVQAMYRYPDGRATERTSTPDGTPTQLVRGVAWLNNDAVNLASSLVGGAVAVLVWWLVAPQ